MKYTIDINCDVGEGMGNEAALMPYISSCSIACGGHAGNAAIIREVLLLAKKHHVKVGAHPSFPDKENFGRTVLDLSKTELLYSIIEQLQLFKTIADELEIPIHHVKAHGALYNCASVDSAYAEVIIKAVQKVFEDVCLYVPFQSILQKLALKNGLKTKVEAFADRNYNEDVTLVSRKLPNAVITDKEQLVTHLLRMITEKKVLTIQATKIRLEAETFCFHGDNKAAIDLLKYAAQKLKENQIAIV